MKSGPPQSRFVLGLAGSHFGLEGFVKVRPFSGETGHFFRLKTVTLRLGGKETDRQVVEVLPHGDMILMRFAGIDSPEAARSLNGAEIVVDREYAAPLNEGEYYVEDLKGFEIITSAGQTLGHLADIIEGGGGQLAEIKLLSGENRFAPFRKEFFGEINPGEGRIILLEPWVLD